jgi:hypothetical protein
VFTLLMGCCQEPWAMLPPLDIRKEAAMTRFILSIFDPLWRYAKRVRAARNRILAERLLASLPAGLRKDIGWPEGCFGDEACREQDAQPAIGQWPGRGENTARRRYRAAAEVLPLSAFRRTHSVPALPTRKAPVSS